MSVASPRLLALTHRPWRLLLWIFALALIVGFAERGIRTARGSTAEPALGAQWIWAEGSFKEGQPLAFYALRDVFLEELPSAAWMALAVDESYILYVNGRAVAGGALGAAGAIDLVPVGSYLKTGWNRLLIEARSIRGAGGILASLRLGAVDRVVLASDASWRIYRRQEAGLMRGWTLAVGEAPRVWGGWKSGRWQIERPEGESLPRAWGPRWAPLTAQRGRQFSSRYPWRQPPAPGRRLPILGPAAVFDWGQEIDAQLRLNLPTDGPRTALVFYGTEAPDLHADRPSEMMISIPGSDRWHSSQPRHFRYVLVAGLQLRYPPTALPVGSDRSLSSATLAPPPGVFGLPPLELKPREEVRIWRRMSPP